jgi:hypothetical protein
MSQPLTTSATTPDVIHDAEPILAQDEVSQAPVLITEQEVMFSTAAAVPLRPPTITRRWIDAMRVVGAAWHRPPGAATPPAAPHLPRVGPHGTRNGQTLSTPAGRRDGGVTGVRRVRRAPLAVVA